jgi:hypothetical protein
MRHAGLHELSIKELSALKKVDHDQEDDRRAVLLAVISACSSAVRNPAPTPPPTPTSQTNRRTVSQE